MSLIHMTIALAKIALSSMKKYHPLESPAFEMNTKCIVPSGGVALKVS
jgi:hypothetical protein